MSFLGVPRPWLPLLLSLVACGAEDDGDTSDLGGDDSGTEEETGGEGTGPDPALCAPIQVDVTSVPGRRELELVAARNEIPGLADQPTVRGRALGALGAFDGRLHLGYGDYSDNTGPITMVAWDPSTVEFVTLGVLPTEEVQWFRPAPGTLYTPATDPDAHQGEGSVFRLDCGSTEWIEGTPIEGAVHAYDVAVRDETIYVGTGSLTGEPGKVMRSSDHGETWEEVLRRESAPGTFSRFYYLGATSDLLFASGRAHPAPVESFAWVHTSNGWLQLADPPPHALVPIVLGEAMVILNFDGDPGRGEYLGTYRLSDGAFVSDEPWPTSDGSPATVTSWTVDPADGSLLFLFEESGGGYTVQRTRDLAPDVPTWEDLLQLDALEGDAFISMSVLLNDLYLGTSLGSLFAVRELQVPTG